MRHTAFLAAVLLSLGGLAPVQAAATFTPATPYLQASNNPLPAVAGYTFLETFEDGLLNTPGVTASAGVVVAPGPFTDSVDADDGAIDGSGNGGRSWYSGSAATTITFTFSAAVLGRLPTQVGIAFTDIGSRNDGGPLGFDTAQIEVFDGAGLSQGSFTFSFGDGSAMGGTAEDRFVGATLAGGIGSMRVGFQHSVDWEVDHLYYAAAAVPEPASALSLLGGLALLAARFAARRQRGAAVQNVPG